jgi:hypothetical protein
MVTEAYLIKRIEMLQEELESLKRTVLKKGTEQTEQLRGIWKGIDIPENAIDETISSLFKE